MSKNCKKNRKKSIIIASIIIFIVLLLVTFGVFGIILSLGILPLKYLIILLVVLSLIYFVIGMIIFNKKIKIWVKILIDIICIVLIAIYLFGYYYLNSTLHFMDKIKADEYQIENYYILVDKKSGISNASDIKTLGSYDNDTESYIKALKMYRLLIRIY